MKIELKNKKDLLVLSIVYVVVVATLGIWLRRIFCPVYGDILLYTDEAKSLADSGTFKFANTYGMSGAYVYPFLISFVYKYFYNAYDIVNLTRFVGVVIMSTTIFPAYILLGKMSVSGKKRIILSALSILIPDMFQSWLQVTEVIAYPLFIWTVVLFYNDVEKKDSIKTSIFVALICFLDYLTRGQFLVISIAYVLCICIFIVQELRAKRSCKGYLKKLVSFIAVFGCLYVAFPRILTKLGVIADTQEVGGSYLSESIEKILSNAPYYLIQWGKGIFWYFFFISLAFGFITVIVPFFHRTSDDNCNKLAVFINTVFVLTVIVVVLVIYSLEEPLDYETHRVHQRYFFFLFIPYLYLFYKIDFSEFKWSKAQGFVMGAFCGFIAFGRFIFQLRENTFLGVEAIALTFFRFAKEIIGVYPYLEVLYTIFVLAVIGIVYLIIQKKGWKYFSSKVFPVMILIAIISNDAIYVKREIYITDVAMANYKERFSPTADFLKDFDTGKVVTVVSELCLDNEVQTFQVINKKCLDAMSLVELEMLRTEGNGDINIKAFDRTGYFYYHATRHRLLSDAEYIAFRHGYTEDKFTISNEIVYLDNFFVVYKLDDGYLHTNSIE